MTYNSKIKEIMAWRPFVPLTLPIETELRVSPTVKNMILEAKLDEDGNPETNFDRAYSYIFEHLRIIPLSNEEIEQTEFNMRWRQSVDSIAENMVAYEGKYCTQVCILFNAMMKGIYYKAWIARLVRKTNEGEIKVHSISIVDPYLHKDEPSAYAVNAGSAKYWVQRVNKPTPVPPKKSFPQIDPIREWTVWRITDEHPWRNGLHRAQDEEKVINEAREYFGK